MSETKSLSAPKASFDRRAVVKGAAWSVPVIAAAIAAPAAAASHHTPPPPLVITPLLTIGGGAFVKHGQAQATGQNRLGTTALALTIGTFAGTNAIEGSVTFKFTPVVGQALDMSLGVHALGTGSLVGTPSLDATTKVFSAKYKFSTMPEANKLLNLPMVLSYAGVDKRGPERKFKMEATITIQGITVSAAASILTVGASN